MKCNETQGKWCKNKHGASKIIDTFETYQCTALWYKIRQDDPSDVKGEPPRKRVPAKVIGMLL
jgi:hypothetical protein